MKRIAITKLERLQMIPWRGYAHRRALHPVPRQRGGQFIHHLIHWLCLQSTLGDLPQRIARILQLYFV